MSEHSQRQDRIRLREGIRRERPESFSLDGLRAIIGKPVMASFIAGGLAGAVSRTLVSPLERTKILFQIQGPGAANYRGVGPTLAKLWREEGFKGFMRGNGTNCIRIVPYSATQFAAYSVYKHLLLNPQETDLDTRRRLTAGALAGITSVTLTYPLDLVRTRLSVMTSAVVSSNYVSRVELGIWATIKEIYRTEGGLFALYRGIFPTVFGVAPYVGLNFAIYEKMRELTTAPGQQHPGPIGKLVSGAISGAIAQSITYPMDVLRRRFQVNSMSGHAQPRYTSLWGACKTIAVEEGYTGFYKGLLPNLLKVAPSMAASWLSFEMIKDFCVSISGTT